MFIGDGAKLVRDAFQLAKEKSPCIIFIDEIYAIGTKRFDRKTSISDYCIISNSASNSYCIAGLSLVFWGLYLNCIAHLRLLLLTALKWVEIGKCSELCWSCSNSLMDIVVMIELMFDCAHSTARSFNILLLVIMMQLYLFRVFEFVFSNYNLRRNTDSFRDLKTSLVCTWLEWGFFFLNILSPTV